MLDGLGHQKHDTSHLRAESINNGLNFTCFLATDCLVPVFMLPCNALDALHPQVSSLCRSFTETSGVWLRNTFRGEQGSSVHSGGVTRCESRPCESLVLNVF
jgi:hypothetical protein